MERHAARPPITSGQQHTHDLETLWRAAGSRGPAAAEMAATHAACILTLAGDHAAAADWLSRAGSATGEAAHATPVRQPAPALSIHNLGQFLVQRDGVALPPCRSSKAVALLRYLLTRPGYAATREELVDQLWPNAGPAAAAHRLHMAASALRRHLDPPGYSYLRYDLGAYRLDQAAAISDDAASFTRLCQEGERLYRAGDLERAGAALAAAVAVYPDDYYLEDCDCAWGAAERDRLLNAYLACLEWLGQIHMQCAEPDRAIGYFQRLIERDGYREDAHCALMRCYQQLGRRSEALRQYERCAALLRDDFGLEPNGEMQGLFRAIGAG